MDIFPKEKRGEPDEDKGDVEVVEVLFCGDRNEVRSLRREERGLRGWKIGDGIFVACWSSGSPG